jgi:hypothetical protein
MIADSTYESSFTGIHTAFFICVAYLGINVLNAVFVAVLHVYQTTSGQAHAASRNGVLLRLLRFNSTLLMGPLYIPVCPCCVCESCVCCVLALSLLLCRLSLMLTCLGSPF